MTSDSFVNRINDLEKILVSAEEVLAYMYLNSNHSKKCLNEINIQKELIDGLIRSLELNEGML